MGITKLLIIISAITLAIVVLLGLAALGFDIPGLRQLLGFIFLTFVPGLLILRILRLNKLTIPRSYYIQSG